MRLMLSKMRRINISQNYVTARLMVDEITDFGENFTKFATRYNRKSAHTITSTSSSVIGGGMASLCFFKLSI